jgi:hypothetical protein
MTEHSCIYHTIRVTDSNSMIVLYGLMVNVRCPGTTATTSPATPPAGQGYATKAEAEKDLTVLRSRLAGETTTGNGTTDDA